MKKINNMKWLHVARLVSSKSLEAQKSRIDLKRRYSHYFKAKILTMAAMLKVLAHSP